MRSTFLSLAILPFYAIAQDPAIPDTAPIPTTLVFSDSLGSLGLFYLHCIDPIHLSLQLLMFPLMPV
jgi:hypothetical protein